MKILAIDTSCDETSVAVTEGARILTNVVSTQVRYHKKFGGVVPFLAQRLHKSRIDSVVELALERAGHPNVDAIAVTYGPGLAPALQVGIEKAKQLAADMQLPLYAVNHMAGHIAASYAVTGRKVVMPEFPVLAVLVSGGHTEMVLMHSFGEFEIIGQTLDDALGEAYDKVAKMLGLGYPGGKLVAKLAREGNAQAYYLPIPMLRSGDLNVSYSGLKNACRLLIEKLSAEGLNRKIIADICASFERVAQASMLAKVEKALIAHPEVRQVVLGGGVAANTEFRKKLRALCRPRDLELLTPPRLNLCADNAAMIGIAAHFGVVSGLVPADPITLDRVPYLSLEDTTFTRVMDSASIDELK
jgi:N6-L-threonylcarbamoyladenine synthase